MGLAGCRARVSIGQESAQNTDTPSAGKKRQWVFELVSAAQKLWKRCVNAAPEQPTV